MKRLLRLLDYLPAMTGTLPMAAACGVTAVIKLHKHMARISNLSPPNLSENNGEHNQNVLLDEREGSDRNYGTIILSFKAYLPIVHLALVLAHNHPKKHLTLYQRIKNPNEMQLPSE